MLGMMNLSGARSRGVRASKIGEKNMPLMEFISLNIDEAIGMLMDGKTGKTEVALFLKEFKKTLNNPEKEIIDGSFREVGVSGIVESGR